MGIFHMIDFTQGAIFYRQQHCQGRNELIAKAIGWKKGLSLSVFDSTAGLGREAFLLASLGCEMTLFERHPDVFEQLRNALEKGAGHASISSIISRMKLIKGCAIHYLQTQQFELPDVIYCDPMFPPRTKSAAVKKEMQWLQALVDPDQDAHELVTLACSKAKKRVVVKSALTASPLKANPHFSLKARTHRFDIYMV